MNPSTKSMAEYVKTHPFASAGAMIIGLTAAGFSYSAVSSFVSNYFNTKAVKENTKVSQDLLKQQDNNFTTPILPIEKNKTKNKETLPNPQPTIQIINQLPPTPQPLSSSPESISSTERVTSKVGTTQKNKKKTIKRKKTLKKHGKAIRSKKRRRTTRIKHRRRISKTMRQKRRGKSK
jgi:hypothetical protein